MNDQPKPDPWLDPRVTIAERDEGQWFAYAANEMAGPYPSAAEARAGLPPQNPARGPWCGCGLYGDHDETHDLCEPAEDRSSPRTNHCGVSLNLAPEYARTTAITIADRATLTPRRPG